MSTPVQVRHCLPPEWRGYGAFDLHVRVQRNAPSNETSTFVQCAQAASTLVYARRLAWSRPAGCTSCHIWAAYLVCGAHPLGMYHLLYEGCKAPLQALPTHSLSVVPRANSQTKSADYILGKHLTSLSVCKTFTGEFQGQAYHVSTEFLKSVVSVLT